MYSFVFKEKLARLNPRLFVDDTQKKHVGGDWYTSALCERVAKRTDDKMDYHYLAADAAKHARALDDGHLYTFVCGVPTGWVPEGDVFLDGKMLAAGWRSILKTLLKKQLTTRAQILKVFGTDLTSTYDSLSFEEKRYA